MRLARVVCVAFLVLLSVITGSGGTWAAPELPELRDGDLIFQTSGSRQSNAVFVATLHPYTHMGIIKKSGSAAVVVEAAGRVRETPLDAWMKRGMMGRISIYRIPDMTAAQTRSVMAALRPYYGKPYDIFFSFDNDALYCSELPYLAYAKAGLSIGSVQKVSDLNLDNAVVKKLIEQRWKSHPVCRAKGYTFEQCYAYVAQQELITPVSIARDPQFKQIYSNYPF